MQKLKLSKNYLNSETSTVSLKIENAADNFNSSFLHLVKQAGATEDNVVELPVGDFQDVRAFVSADVDGNFELCGIAGAKLTKDRQDAVLTFQSSKGLVETTMSQTNWYGKEEVLINMFNAMEECGML